jgi:uncharacterized membrane protein YuzA (DUF378 family)
METVRNDSAPRKAGSTIGWIAFTLLVIGGLNWGLVGLFEYDLVAGIFGEMSPVARLTYVLVGLSALYCAFAMPAMRKRIHDGRAGQHA